MLDNTLKMWDYHSCFRTACPFRVSTLKLFVLAGIMKNTTTVTSLLCIWWGLENSRVKHQRVKGMWEMNLKLWKKKNWWFTEKLFPPSWDVFKEVHLNLAFNQDLSVNSLKVRTRLVHGTDSTIHESVDVMVHSHGIFSRSSSLKFHGWVFGMGIGIPICHIGVPGLGFGFSASDSSFLQVHTYWGSRWWVKYLSLCHPPESPRLNSRLLASACSAMAIWIVTQQLEDLCLSPCSLPFS